MKKTFKVVALQQMNQLPKGSNALSIAYRNGDKIQYQNLNLDPGSIAFENGQLVLRFSLQEGQHLVLYDEGGMADKGST